METYSGYRVQISLPIIIIEFMKGKKKKEGIILYEAFKIKG